MLDEATSALSDHTLAPIDAALAACCGPRGDRPGCDGPGGDGPACCDGAHGTATVLQIAHQTAAVMRCDEATHPNPNPSPYPNPNPNPNPKPNPMPTLAPSQAGPELEPEPDPPQVVVMVAGRLAERGPPQELLDGRCGDGLFASLVAHDARGQAWDSRHQSHSV